MQNMANLTVRHPSSSSEHQSSARNSSSAILPLPALRFKISVMSSGCGTAGVRHCVCQLAVSTRETFFKLRYKGKNDLPLFYRYHWIVPVELCWITPNQNEVGLTFAQIFSVTLAPVQYGMGQNRTRRTLSGRVLNVVFIYCTIVQYLVGTTNSNIGVT